MNKIQKILNTLVTPKKHNRAVQYWVYRAVWWIESDKQEKVQFT